MRDRLTLEQAQLFLPTPLASAVELAEAVAAGSPPSESDRSLREEALLAVDLLLAILLAELVTDASARWADAARLLRLFVEPPQQLELFDGLCRSQAERESFFGSDVSDWWPGARPAMVKVLRPRGSERGLAEAMLVLGESLGWLAETCMLTPLSSRGSSWTDHFEGTLLLLRGLERCPPVRSLTWTGEPARPLVVGRTYLLRGGRSLELCPFVDVLRLEESDEVRVLAAQGRRSSGELVLGGAEEPRLVSVCDDADRSDCWDTLILDPRSPELIRSEFNDPLGEVFARGARLGAERTILEPVGVGRLGALLTVRHDSGRIHAISLLEALDGPPSLEQARAEAGRLRRSPHDGLLVGVPGVLCSGRAFVELPQPGGHDLETLLGARSGPGEPELPGLAHQLFSALAHLHDLGLVHGSISPGRIVIEEGRLGLIWPGSSGICANASAHSACDDVAAAAHALAELLLGHNVRLETALESEDLSPAWLAFLRACLGPRGRRPTAVQACAMLEAAWGLCSVEGFAGEPVVLDNAPAELGRRLCRRLESGETASRALGSGARGEAAELWEQLRSRHLGKCWHSLVHRPELRIVDLLRCSGRGFCRSRALRAACRRLGHRVPLEWPTGPEHELVELAALGQAPARLLRVRDWTGCLGWSIDRLSSESRLLRELLEAVPLELREGLPVNEVCESLDWDVLLELLPERPYSRRRIPKRSGGGRWLHEPAPLLATLQRKLARLLRLALPGISAATGFVAQRSAALHARLHEGARGAVVLDLHDFFGSVSFTDVRRSLAEASTLRACGYPRGALGLGQLADGEVLKRLCFVREPTRQRDFLPQGAATSPALANLAAARLDLLIEQTLEQELPELECRYSRYADDLVVSSARGGHRFHEDLEELLRRCIAKVGWTVNSSKVRHWSAARGGPLVVCGIRVPERPGELLGLPRSVRRRLRAAVHRAHSRPDDPAARGLMAYGYSVTGRHGLAVLVSGRLRECVRKLGLSLLGDEASALELVEGWCSEALRDDGDSKR